MSDETIDFESTKRALSAYGTKDGEPVCDHVRQFHQAYGLMPCAHRACPNSVGGQYWTPYGLQSSHDVVFMRTSAGGINAAGDPQWLCLPVGRETRAAEHGE